MNSKSKAHYWIKRNFGKADRCDNCHIKDSSRYEWSNKNHKYNLVRGEWQRLCKSCHSNYDIQNGLITYKKYRNEMPQDEILTCSRCDYQWLPRINNLPRACPKCKSYNWKKVAETNRK